MGPDVNHGVAFSGPGAETQLRPKCYLWFDQSFVSVVNRPQALFLRLSDVSQNLIVQEA